jgi:hypothetical protein
LYILYPLLYLHISRPRISFCICTYALDVSHRCRVVRTFLACICTSAHSMDSYLAQMNTRYIYKKIEGRRVSRWSEWVRVSAVTVHVSASCAVYCCLSLLSLKFHLVPGATPVNTGAIIDGNFGRGVKPKKVERSRRSQRLLSTLSNRRRTRAMASVLRKLEVPHEPGLSFTQLLLTVRGPAVARLD